MLRDTVYDMNTTCKNLVRLSVREEWLIHELFPTNTKMEYFIIQFAYS